jgi:hypothetical protein
MRIKGSAPWPASRPDLRDRLAGERLIGASQHLLGDQRSARLQVERALADDVSPNHRSDIIKPWGRVRT